MLVHTTDAYDQITQVVSSIDLRPDSWKGWTALRVAAGEYLSVTEFEDGILPIKAIIGSYLREVEGAAYFCNSRYIYMICKGPHKNTLKQTAQQISELVFEEIYLSSASHVYDLTTDAEIFAHDVFQDIGRPFDTIAEGTIENGVPSFDKAQETMSNDTSNVKVLLVEDDAVIRWMVRNSLKYECDFATAPTAQNVFSMYDTFQPDIVFLDIGLPDDNGKQVLDWILKHNPHAYIVMLSGQDNLENISHCIGQGAKGFIAKPFLKENLLHYIHGYQKAG